MQTENSEKNSNLAKTYLNIEIVSQNTYRNARLANTKTQEKTAFGSNIFTFSSYFARQNLSFLKNLLLMLVKKLFASKKLPKKHRTLDLTRSKHPHDLRGNLIKIRPKFPRKTRLGSTKITRNHEDSCFEGRRVTFLVFAFLFF